MIHEPCVDFDKTDRPEVMRMLRRIRTLFRRRGSVLGFVLAVLVVLAELTLAAVVLA